MASTIQIKRGTGSAVPTGLSDGELAINLDSGKLYFGSGSTSVANFSFGELTAEKYIVSSSVLYVTTSFSSGSTEFGDTADDTHTFTGAITASGDISASGNLIVNDIMASGGTLTSLDVDDINLNGKVITITGDTDDTFSITAGAAGVTTLATTDATSAGGHIKLVADGTIYLEGKVGKTIFRDLDNAVDYLQLSIGAHGGATFTTVDTAAGNAHFEVVADGDILLDPTGGITLDGPVTASGNISSSGNIISDNAYHKKIYDGTTPTETDTFIELGGSTNEIDIYSANRKQINVGFSQIVFNQAGNDVDVVIEGDTDPHLFRTNAGTDRVGIGTLSPTAKLGVDGNINTNSHITASGNISSSGNVYAANVYVPTDGLIAGADPNNQNIKFESTSELEINSSTVTIDAAVVNIDSSTGIVNFKDASTTQFSLDMDGTAGAQVLQLKVAGDDLIFKSQGGDPLMTLKSEGQTEIHSNITASGNISSSGNVTANAFAGTVSTATQGTIDHDSLANFVADEHVAHGDVSIVAGTGLTGGGTIAANRTLNVIGGDGITANANDIAITAAQTTITSLLAADIKIGEDDQTKIDFETEDEIHFYANNIEQVYLADNIFGPQSDSDVDLGTTGVRWKDAFIDTITTTGNISSSAFVHGTQFKSHNNLIGLYHEGSSTTRLGDIAKLTSIYGTNITLISPVTASGNISSSGTVIANAFEGTSISANRRNFTVTADTAGLHDGDVVYFGGEATIAAGQLVHYNSSGNWELADADAVATSDGLLGVALGSDASVNGVLLKGAVTLDHDAGAIGDVLYISTTAGDCTATAPSGTNDVVRIIGYKIFHASEKQIWFDPSNDFIIHA